jgi:WD40 repeat protein
MSSSHLYCNECGAANKSNAHFCRACGQPLSGFSSGTHTMSMRSSTDHLILGHILNKRYRILTPLGEGGMGSVYKAEDIQLGKRLVAVKEMLHTYSRSQEEFVDAAVGFKREALMLADLRHQSLPRIYDHFGDSGRWYLVMDYIEGETLGEHLNKANGGRLPIEKVLDIGLQLCVVLGYLHTHKPPIIFRDLKPDNVMLTQDGHIYLIDFGIARHFQTGKAKDTKTFVSRGYSAPEQYDKGQTTPRSDIYSLGATLHQLLSGNDPSLTPFRFDPLQLGSHLYGSNLGTLVMQMVEMDEYKRPANMVTVKQELQRIQDLQRIIAQRADEQKKSVHPEPPPLDPPPSVSQGKETDPAKQANFPPSISQQPTIKQPVPPPPLREMQMRHTGLIWTVAWSQDGTRIASGGEDKTVKVWDMSIGESLLTYRGHAPNDVRAVAWSRDGQRIASGGWDKTVQVWDVASGNTILTYRGHSDYIRAVAWSTDGTRIASAGKDKMVQVWDAAAGSNIYTYTAHADVVSAVTWSPDGTRLASASQLTVRVWNASTGGGLFTYSHTSSVYGLAWSPDGKHIASCSEDRTVQVWDITTKQCVRTYPGHSNWVYAVAWSPDSLYLVSTSKDKTVQVWTLTGNAVIRYPCQTEQVYTVAWSPDGKRLAYGDGRMMQVKLLPN